MSQEISKLSYESPEGQKFIENCKELYQEIFGELPQELPQTAFEWAKIFYNPENRQIIAEKINEISGVDVIDGSDGEFESSFEHYLRLRFKAAFVNLARELIAQDKEKYVDARVKEIIVRIKGRISQGLLTSVWGYDTVFDRYTGELKEKKLTEQDLTQIIDLTNKVKGMRQREILFEVLGTLGETSIPRVETITSFLSQVDDTAFERLIGEVSKNPQSQGQDNAQEVDEISLKINRLEAFFDMVRKGNVENMAKLVSLLPPEKWVSIVDKLSDKKRCNLKILIANAEPDRFAKILAQVDESVFISFVENIQDVKYFSDLMSIVNVGKIVYLLNSKNSIFEKLAGGKEKWRLKVEKIAWFLNTYSHDTSWECFEVFTDTPLLALFINNGSIETVLSFVSEDLSLKRIFDSLRYLERNHGMHLTGIELGNTFMKLSLSLGEEKVKTLLRLGDMRNFRDLRKKIRDDTKLIYIISRLDIYQFIRILNYEVPDATKELLYYCMSKCSADNCVQFLKGFADENHLFSCLSKDYLSPRFEKFLVNGINASPRYLELLKILDDGGKKKLFLQLSDAEYDRIEKMLTGEIQKSEWGGLRTRIYTIVEIAQMLDSVKYKLLG